MPNASNVQSSFAGGEWSPEMQGHIELPEYKTALALSFNGLPIETAAHSRRPGTLVAQTTRGGAPAKLIRFDFADAYPYNIEFTDGFLRFFNGRRLITTNDAQTVTAISAATPAVVTTGTAHGWATDDYVMFSGTDPFPAAGINIPTLQSRQFKITVLSSTTFSLADGLTGAAIVGAGLGFFVAAMLRINRIHEVASPYESGRWATTRAITAEQQAVLLNTAVAPQVLSLTQEPTGQLEGQFALAEADFKDGPYLDPFPGSWITPSGASGVITLTLSFQPYSASVVYSKGDYVSSGGSGYKSLQNSNFNNAPAGSPAYWGLVSTGDPVGPSGFTLNDIGRHIRIASEPALWNSSTSYSIGNSVTYNGTYWTALTNHTGKTPGQDIVNWAILATGLQWSWGKITGISGGVSVASGTPFGNLYNSSAASKVPVTTLAAAFDGTANSSAAQAATTAYYDQGTGAANFISLSLDTTGYVGLHFGTPQTIGLASIAPSNNLGFLGGKWNDTAGYTAASSFLTVNLRAKHTAPASSSDGTLLGTTGRIANSTAAVSIASTDAVTAWEYVWAEIVPDSGRGVMSIAELSFSTASAATVGNTVTFAILGPALPFTTASRKWRLGLFGSSSGWPTVGTYHEGRMWLSGVVKNRIDASKSNDIFNFAPTEADGTVTDASALDYTFNSPDENSIYWMEPDQQGVICGTQGGEWLVSSAQDKKAITPTSIAARRVTKIKCADVEPVRTEHTIAFVQKNGRRLQEYFADVYSGKFSSPNLALRAKHLTKSGIKRLAYQQDLAPIIWVLRNDGVLAGAVYKRDSLISSQGPTYVGWHWHTLGSGRIVEDIVAGPSAAGDGESLSMVTSDGTYRYVEVLGDIYDSTNDVEDANFLDFASPAASYEVTDSAVKFYGLWHLNGLTATVWAAGLDCGDFVISNGSVTVPFGDGVAGGTGRGLFTSERANSYGDNALPNLIGLPFVSRGKALAPAGLPESGARQGPAVGKIQRSHQFVCRMVASRGVSFGTDFAKMRPAIFRTRGGQDIPIDQMFTGTYQGTLDDDYTLETTLCWEVTRPYPLTITALGGFLSTQDR